MKPYFSKPLLVAALLTAGGSTLAAQPDSQLRLAYKADILSVDPHAIAESTQLDILGNVYEGLVEIRPDGSIAPALAERWEQRGDKVWRFKLRPGVRFHQELTGHFGSD